MPRISRQRATRDDSVIRELVPTRVRFTVQSRKPTNGTAATSYSQLPGHTHIVEVRTLREFRRLWRLIAIVIDAEEWRDVRRASTPDSLPAAGVPLAGDRS